MPDSKSLTVRFAENYGIEPTKLINTLQKTAFKEARTNEEFMSLLVVAEQYGLNPFTKEIYAFPAKGGGVMPLVSIDGWLKIISNHPQFDGLRVEYSIDMTEVNGTRAPVSCTVTMYRKDYSQPIPISERFSECFRNTDPWRTCPYRMLRHKTIIQCARVAFGFGGIYDRDEAERIDEMEPETVGSSSTLEDLNQAVLSAKAVFESDGEPLTDNETLPKGVAPIEPPIEVEEPQSDAWPRLKQGSWYDSNGEVFDKDKHGWSGKKPSVRADGSFRTRRGVVARVEPEAEQLRPEPDEAPIGRGEVSPVMPNNLDPVSQETWNHITHVGAAGLGQGNSTKLYDIEGYPCAPAEVPEKDKEAIQQYWRYWQAKLSARAKAIEEAGFPGEARQ